ncbi:MAG: hypothetical protein CL596_04960 [Alteromonas sp.]|nr:hypothetical protein [Alteromonas sp.]|tara:strand:- start:10093 stop:12336 length:2244 start_codon:yes stop_codon:yes gene_type:complete
MPSKFKIIRTKSTLKRVIRYCKQTGYACVDFETNALPINHPLFYPTVLGITFQPGSSYVLPLAHFDSPFKKSWPKLFKLFCKEVIENPEIIKVAQNAKFEYKIFLKYGYEIKGRIFDTMLAKYLLDEEKPMGLKPMVNNFIPEYAGYEEDYDGAKLPWDQKPLKGLSEYCGLDTDLTLRLMFFYEDKLIKNNLYSLFRNMLMMGVRVLGDSEYGGMDVDIPYLDNLIIEYENYLEENDKKIRNTKTLNKFQKWLDQSRINKLMDKVVQEIEEVEEEVEEIKAEIKRLKKKVKKKKHKGALELIHKNEVVLRRKEKSIRTREDKIDRYRAREMSTKTEVKCLEPINFNSSNQMVDLFFTSPQGFQFDIIKYTVDKKTKKESDRPSTDEEVLEQLKPLDKSGFVEGLLRHRELSKLYSTYIKGIRDKCIDGKVHARFLLEGTVTGRLSSQNPNLQNIPRDTTAKDIKKMFVPPKGYYLLQLDYSQAELRVMAAQAGEETMIRWFKEGKDIHLTTALKMYRQEERYDEIFEVLEKEDKKDPRYTEWKVRRKYAKTINFGIIYGQGVPKLANSLGWTIEEAQTFLNEYFDTFPKIREFIKQQHKIAHRDAFVRNVFGRKRRLPKIDSYEKWEVAEAERQSVNAPIQGAASDYTLFSSIIIWEEVRKKNIPIYKPQVYTVHDSLGYYVRAEDIHDVVPKLEKICANPETMEWFNFQIDDVTMKVDFELSSISWQALKTYDPKIDYTKQIGLL